MNADRRYPLILLVACLVLFTFQLGNRDLWAPDEPRYTGVARAILESGDWLVLRDNGQVYTDKPPLFFWVLAWTARLGSGMSAFTARIPSSLLALLSVLSLYRLGRDLFGPRVGLLGGFVLATSQRFFLEARWVHIDMLLCFLSLVTMDALYRTLQEEKEWCWVVVYTAIGLGCLAKGPVALAIPAAVLMLYLASTRQLSLLRKTRWVWGIPAALSPMVIWLLASARRAGFDPREVVRAQVLQRFQEGMHHPRPFYYYLYSLPLEFLPWTPFLAGAVAMTFPAPGRRDRRPLLFLYSWVLGVFALFTLSAEKRPSYLLPLFPALALLVGLLWEAYLVRWSVKSVRKWIEVPLLVYAVICLCAAVLLPSWAVHFPGLAARSVPLSIFYLLVCSVAVIQIRTRRRGAALLSLLSGLLLGYLWIIGFLFPWLNGYKSARPFCERVAARIGAAPLGIYGDYQPAYAFYTHRRLDVLRRPEDLAGFLAVPQGAYCLVERHDLASLNSRVSLRVLDQAAVGHRTYLLTSAGSGNSDRGTQKPPEEATP